MKTIGLVGGISWYSSVDYYRYINQLVTERLGGDEAARLVLNSVNYGEIKRLTKADDWRSIATLIIEAARQTVAAGAECILLGANTMHHIAGEVEAAIDVPLIHIADATAKAIREKGISKVALLGTKYTMQFDFYRKRLSAHGISSMIPAEAEIEFINHCIYEELGKGVFTEETKERFIAVISDLMEEGAEGVILGCTEIPLLIKQEDSPVPVFDTTWLHAKAAVDFSLG